MKRAVGDECPYCLRILTEDVFAEKKRRISVRRTNTTGLKPRKNQVNYQLIRHLISQGKTVKEISLIVGCSTTPVLKTLKEMSPEDKRLEKQSRNLSYLKKLARYRKLPARFCARGHLMTPENTRMVGHRRGCLRCYLEKKGGFNE